MKAAVQGAGERALAAQMDTEVPAPEAVAAAA